MSKDWPLVNLGDIFAIARGGSPRPIDSYLTDDPDGVNWIMISDASESGKQINSTKKRIRREGVVRSRMVHPGDFILTNSMSFGRPYIMNTSGCVHDGWLVLSPRSHNISPDFFYYLLGSNFVYAEFERRAAGATVKNLNIDLVSAVQVPLPPLAEQRRIAAILDAADALREKRRQALAKLDGLVQAVFLEMFGDAETKGWAMQSVSDLAANIPNAIRTGPFGSQLLHSEFVEEGIAVLGIDNAVQNAFAWAKPRFITDRKYESLRRYTVRPGDILITIMGTCGRCAIVPNDIPVAINTKHLCCISLDQQRCLPRYFHAAFQNHPAVMWQLGIRERGAVMPGLNMQLIKELQIPVPPLAVQTDFDRFLQTHARLRQNCLAALAHLDALFTSLQQRAFRGEL